MTGSPYLDRPCRELAEVLLNYEPETGTLRWRHRPKAAGRWNTRFAGKVAGTIAVNGYVQVSIFGKKDYAHRLAWLLMTGEWPAATIDHVDGDRSNNRFANLRQATVAENTRNSKGRRSDGLKGIYFHKASGLWHSTIMTNGVKTSIGYFRTADEAHAAYAATCIEQHGEFARAK